MLHEVIETLEKAKAVQERTAKRLEDLVVPETNGFTFGTNRDPACVNRICESEDAQILTVDLIPNTVCDEHKHIGSYETFVVIKGVINYNRRRYKEGKTFVVPAGKTHKIGTGKEGGRCIVILVPPEEAYRGANDN